MAGDKVKNDGVTHNVVSLKDAKSKAGGTPSDDVLIHVRFHPNADVNTIDRCPEHLTRQNWFYHLCYSAPQNYQVFAGGRGFFRMQRDVFEAALNKSAK